MPCTVRQLARMSGVSVRTLHHYDQTGLLRPAARSDAGYRLYGEPELLRLQQILFYRALGVPLKDIAALLQASDLDTLEALGAHRRALLERQKSLSALLNVPLWHDIMERATHTPPQAELPWKERARNIKGAFRTVGFVEAQLKGLHVAVVDDVMTTGATLNELAKVLKKAGAARVTNYVVARTLPKI